MKLQLVLFAVWTGLAMVSALSPFELKIFNNKEQSGIMIMKCRDRITGDDLNTADVHFWLNRTSTNDSDLRQRDDVLDTVDDNSSIRFTLTRNLEGNYTCGTRSDADSVQESDPRILISHASNLDSSKTIFTATSGSTAELHCPIQPGALLQYYSVEWSKDGAVIASLNDRGHLNSTDSHYNLERSTFSLKINPVNMGDSSTSYKCEVYVKYPQSQDVSKLKSSDVSLTLYVHDMLRISSMMNHKEQPSFECVVNYTSLSPSHTLNITWTYINKGVETNITEGDDYHIIVSSIPQGGDRRLYTASSILTFLNFDLAENDNGVVRCKIGEAAVDVNFTTIVPGPANLCAAANVKVHTSCTCHCK